MEDNNFKINEFVTLVRKDTKDFIISPILNPDNVKTASEIKGIVKVNKPLFKNSVYIDRKIAIQVIGEIGFIYLVDSQIERKK